MNQLRDVVRTATIYTGGVYEGRVPNELWEHFISCFMEILKAAQYQYPRLRHADLIHDGLLILITVLDAAQGQILYCYLSHPMETGRSINNILGKGYLCSETQTIPQKELGVLSVGTFITKTLKEELGSRLGRTIVATNSLVAIY